MTFEEKCERLMRYEGVVWVWGTQCWSTPDEKFANDPIVAELFNAIGDGETWKLERPLHGSPRKEIVCVARNGEKRLAVCYDPGSKIVKSLTRMMKRAMA